MHYNKQLLLHHTCLNHYNKLFSTKILKEKFENDFSSSKLQTTKNLQCIFIIPKNYISIANSSGKCQMIEFIHLTPPRQINRLAATMPRHACQKTQQKCGLEDLLFSSILSADLI
jgi:hypothetical protein